jgi:hypothetical protein
MPYAYQIRKSTNSKKKWDVFVPTSARLRKVSYGAKGMSDYTIHKSKARRERYRARHIHDKIGDPYKAGFWSWYHLWGASSDSTTAFNAAVRLAKRILKS